ncbi:restriction endonuclease subunit S [Roseobacter sp.]|uniref:restriction endonuclease subunit S n=1 Tax=Roseobacter sp. TaxID=1907202 RepID=UPI0029666AE8|nr:restriction endonuclease subunit S [Roseobacter sp.]MDW3181499.1 restriction endonuclease subunit S [Roseobacter sp.]
MKDATFSSARLLEFYERISDAEDAIPRLRRLVLDLAVRGKLVEQDAHDKPEDFTPSDKSGKTLGSRASSKKVPPSVEPYSLPKMWKWVEIGDQLDLLNGMAFKPSDWASDGLRIVRIQNLNRQDAPFNYCDPNFARERSLIDDGSFLISWSGTPGTSFGAFIWDRGPAVLNQHIFRCDFKTEAFTPKYLRLAINGRLDEMIEKAHGGVGLQHITKGKLEAMLIGLPPLAEQHRIVAKVDELMALCDQLEQARAGREAVRDRLTTASLARLTAPDTTAEDFPTHAAFALEALPAFTTRPDQIKTLRQTIMNLAVRGKLVKQDRANGSGAELMANIASSIDPRKFTRVDHNLIDFAVPEGWDLQCLDAITQDGPKNGLSPTKTENPTAPKAITLTATTSGQFDGRHFKHVDVSLEAAEPFWLQPNDLLFQRGNTPEYVGIAAIYDGPEREFLYPDLIMRVRISSKMDLRFVHLWCISPVARNYLMANATGAQKTMPKINQGVLKALPIMIPPLAEQHRIVAKVDALMTLCDQLEASLTTTDTTRSKLLNALLHETLEPAADELEAAE